MSINNEKRLTEDLNRELTKERNNSKNITSKYEKTKEEYDILKVNHTKLLKIEEENKKFQEKIKNHNDELKSNKDRKSVDKGKSEGKE